MQRLTRLVIATALTFVAAVATAQPKDGGGDQGLEFEPESAQSGPPSKTLERAVKLYDK